MDSSTLKSDASAVNSTPKRPGTHPGIVIAISKRNTHKKEPTKHVFSLLSKAELATAILARTLAVQHPNL